MLHFNASVIVDGVRTTETLDVIYNQELDYFIVPLIKLLCLFDDTTPEQIEINHHCFSVNGKEYYIDADTLNVFPVDSQTPQLCLSPGSEH